jgi:LCP family protein required for cell wall assembly
VGSVLRNAWSKLRALPIAAQAGIAAVLALLLIGTGVAVSVNLVEDRIDSAIPQTDLFGDGTPSPSATAGGSPAATTPPPPTPAPGAGIKGPLNILIVGVDTRYFVPGWQPHADAVMILHVSKDLKRAYLNSLPRDLVVQIPAFRKAGYSGGRTKLTHAMSYGSRVPGKQPSQAQGFELVALTVSNYTGIKRFDAGVVINFTGFEKVINLLGGVDMYVDQQVKSIHLRPDGKYRTPSSGSAHGYSGPQATYNVGMRHFVGWQALDYARQRYVPGGAYTRDRHQRQLIKAMIAKGFQLDLFSDAMKIQKIVTALGPALTFDGRGKRFVDFAFALRGVTAGNLTLVGLPGSSVTSGGTYLGEGLAPIQGQYFAALRGDRIDPFLKANPSLINNR